MFAGFAHHSFCEFRVEPSIRCGRKSSELRFSSLFFVSHFASLHGHFSHACGQIARADVADAVIQSVSPNGSKALVGVAMAIICITACNLACAYEQHPQPPRVSYYSTVVFWQIKTDNLDHIWPIRMLRGIIIITITTLFPTFLDLCLRPLNVRIARFFQMKRSCVQLMPFNRIANVSVHVALIVEQCDFWSDASPCNTR